MAVARVGVAGCAWPLAAGAHPSLITDAAALLAGAGAMPVAVVGVGVTDAWEARAKQQMQQARKRAGSCQQDTTRSTMHGTAVVGVALRLLSKQHHKLLVELSNSEC